MLKKLKSLILLTFLVNNFSCSKVDNLEPKKSDLNINSSKNLTSKGIAEIPITLGYFPSWADSYVTAATAKNSTLAKIPSSVSHIFIAFAKPGMRYVKGSYDLRNTGIQFSYDGPALKAVIAVLNKKGTKVILSIGGETYWSSGVPTIYYQEIADFVKDFGLAGVDWDFEPDGSFQSIGSTTNINNFITFIRETRKVLPRSGGYIIAVAPAGCGALGGLINDDTSSKYKYANRNTITGDTDAFLNAPTDKTHSISLFGFASTGHMIPVFKAAGSDLDIVAHQAYNVGGAPNRLLMYNSYAYYANIYGFKVAAGVHVPNEPWGPYYTSNALTTAQYAKSIADGGSEGRSGKGDGVMTWELLLQSKYTGETIHNGTSYLNICRNVFNGQTPITAVRNAFVYPPDPVPFYVAPVTVSVATTYKGQEAQLGIKQNGKILAYLNGNQTFISPTTLKAGFYSWTFTTPGLVEFVLQDINGHLSDATSIYVTPTNQCGIDGWNSTKVYDLAGKQVFHEGWIWTNQWWTQGNIPGREGVPYPVWKKVRQCL